MQLANGHEAAAAKNVGRPPASAVAAAGSGAGAAVRRVRRKPLEPPPKLCFELLKDKDLKAKLSGLGLSTEGNKKVGRICCLWSLQWFIPLHVASL